MGATRYYALFAAAFLCPPIAVSQQSKLPRLPGTCCAAACPCGACAAVSSKPAVVPPTQTHMHLQVAIARDDLDTYFCKPRCTDLAPLWLAAASVGRCSPAATCAAAAAAAAATRGIFSCHFSQGHFLPYPTRAELAAHFVRVAAGESALLPARVHAVSHAGIQATAACTRSWPASSLNAAHILIPATAGRVARLLGAVHPEPAGR